MIAVNISVQLTIGSSNIKKCKLVSTILQVQYKTHFRLTFSFEHSYIQGRHWRCTVDRAAWHVKRARKFF